MEAIELVAAKRTSIGKQAEGLRGGGLVPAVVYGHDVPSSPIEVDAREMARVYAKAGGNKIITLKIGSGKAQNVLIQDVQAGALRGELTHVDFYVVRMNEELTAEVPIHFIGESAAVRQQDGMLLKQFESIEVQCLPAALPQSIEVDISVLDDFEKAITLADIVLPSGVKFTSDDVSQIIAKVEPPRTEAQMAELEETVGDTAPVVDSGAEAEAPAKS